jgi:hypothetical protein
MGLPVKSYARLAVPYYNSAHDANHGTLVLYDTTKPFADPASYAVIQLASFGLSPVPKVFSVLDQRR